MNFIMKRALRNIWCNPEVDRAGMYRLTRVSNPLGDIQTTELTGVNYDLPISNNRCHVYMIGQLWPTVLNLFPIFGSYVDTGWISLSSVCSSKNVIMDLYTDRGIHHPLHRAWYRFHRDHGLCICVEHLKQVDITYRDENLYLRTYKNAYYTTDEYKNSSNNSIMVVGDVISSESKLLIWQQTYKEISEKVKGSVLAYVNGVLVNRIDPLTTKINDIIEIVYDPTIVKVVMLPISELHTFSSILDKGNRKYLIHYPDDHTRTIEYYDDNEIYVVYPYNQSGSYLGRYYHRNMEDSVRMVTHRDYSLNVDYVRRLAEGIRNEIGEPIPIENMYIQLYVRSNSLSKELDFEHTRIHELYNLSDELIVRSMIGLDSVVNEWKAENLENSEYCKLMRTKDIRDISDELVENVYGYNAMSYYTGYTPQVVNKGKCVIDHYYSNNCTVYEYDTDGRMLGSYNHSTGRNYSCSNKSCATIEVYAGKGTKNISVYYGKDDLPYIEGCNFRLYLCDGYDINKGTSVENWKDITDSDMYEIVGDKVKWKLESTSHMLQIRYDDTFLMYNTNVKSVKGVLSFTLQEFITKEGLLDYYDMVLPMGELDIYLNGYNLIENVDYYVNFPTVYIVNKKYLKPSSSGIDIPDQSIHVRFCGFCNKDLSRDAPDDHGFIVHNVLSHNSVYDIRSDRVIRVIVDGKMKLRDQVSFSEFTKGDNLLSKYNGLPYMIRDIVVPLQNTTLKDTYAYRSKSIAMDKLISDYMTLKFPEPSRSNISAIPNRHPVASPFISRVIHAVLDKEIDISKTKLKDTSEIKEALRKYEYLLEVDPISRETDHRFIAIHPWLLDKEITITTKEYRYIRKVVDMYAKQLIDLTPFFKNKDK